MLKPITSTVLQRSRLFLLSSLFILSLLLLCRVLFHLYYHNTFDHISGKELFKIYSGGFYFDLSAMAVINGLFILWMSMPVNSGWQKTHNKIALFIFIVCNALGLALNLFDIAFFDFTHKRLTLEILTFGGSQDDFMNLLPSFLRNYWYLVIIFIVLVLVIRQFGKQYILPAFTQPAQSFKTVAIGSFATLVLWVGLSILNFRGWLAMYPLDMTDAGKFASAQNIPLVLNTPFTFTKSIGHRSITQLQYFSPEESDKIFSPVQYGSSGKSRFVKRNIVIIALESFSKEFTAAANRGVSFTPFIDSIQGESLYFSNAWSNGKQSVQGIPAIMAAIPSLSDMAFTQSAYASNNYKGLAGILSDEHYYTAFFHGCNNGSFNFDAFASQAGYHDYYGRNEYNNEKDYDGCWGIWDEPFLQFTAKKMHGFKEPFHTAIFNISSHQPFKVPEKYKDRFKGDENPLTKAVQYADFSIRLFFEQIKTEPWFKNTIFVFSADHTGLSPHHFFDNLAGQYQIPIMIYDPSQQIARGVDSSTISQSDIMPTLLHLLGYNKPFFAFGNDIYQRPSFAVNYTSGTYNMSQGSYLYSFNGTTGVSLYNYQQDSLLQHNLLNLPQDTVSKKMEKTLKAYLQAYTDGVKNNRMCLQRYPIKTNQGTNPHQGQ